MPIPMNILLAAATKIAQDERAQKVARSMFDAGSDAVQKRLKAKGARDELAAPTPSGPTEKGKGWRTGFDRKVKFRRGATGDLIRFRYTDEHGLATQRTVGNWRSDGQTLTGFCLNMKAEQVFAIRGIENWEDIVVGDAV